VTLVTAFPDWTESKVLGVSQVFLAFMDRTDPRVNLVTLELWDRAATRDMAEKSASLVFLEFTDWTV